MRWCEEYNFKPEAVSSVSLISTLTERGKRIRSSRLTWITVNSRLDWALNKILLQPTSKRKAKHKNLKFLFY